ncbi:MAG: pyridoxal phosphate-dependent aminotransferase [Promethearchaeota archaeon]
MKPVSRAVRDSKKSSIRELFELVLSAKDAISLGIGQPDFPTPPRVLEAIKRALDEGKTMYAPTLGIPELREQVARKFREQNGMRWVQPENTIVVNGGSQGIQLAFAVLTNPGDEVLISSPNFISYYYVAGYYQARVVEVPRRDDFGLDLDALAAAVTDKTKLMVVNSPNNPTGYALTRGEVDAVVDLANEHDLYLLSDEVYEHFLYGGREHASPASYGGMEDRVLTLNALSKTFAGTGLRCGYLAASRELVDLMEKYAQYTAAGVNHPTQYGAVEALKWGNPRMQEIVARYDAKRRLVQDRLREVGFDCPTAHGAFYVMPRVSAFADSGAEFSKALMREREVAVVPGDAFGSHSDDRVRVSYATSDEKLGEALDRVEAFVRDRR